MRARRKGHKRLLDWEKVTRMGEWGEREKAGHARSDCDFTASTGSFLQGRLSAGGLDIRSWVSRSGVP